MHMFSKTTSLGEFLIAFFTFEWLLSCIYRHMSVKTVSLGKCLITFRTFEWPFSADVQYEKKSA